MERKREWVEVMLGWRTQCGQLALDANPFLASWHTPFGLLGLVPAKELMQEFHWCLED